MDGTADNFSSDRFDIESFPTFVAIEPGSKGNDWEHWHTRNRNYDNMKRWLKKKLQDHNLMPLHHESAADKLANNYHLSAALPLAENQPSAALFQKQMDENKKMAEMIQSMFAS